MNHREISFSPSNLEETDVQSTLNAEDVDSESLSNYKDEGINLEWGY